MFAVLPPESFKFFQFMRIWTVRSGSMMAHQGWVCHKRMMAVDAPCKLQQAGRLGIGRPGLCQRYNRQWPSCGQEPHNRSKRQTAERSRPLAAGRSIPSLSEELLPLSHWRRGLTCRCQDGANHATDCRAVGRIHTGSAGLQCDQVGWSRDNVRAEPRLRDKWRLRDRRFRLPPWRMCSSRLLRPDRRLEDALPGAKACLCRPESRFSNAVMSLPRGLCLRVRGHSGRGNGCPAGTRPLPLLECRSTHGVRPRTCRGLV